MAWCPKCKSEYVEGITECVDCGCELVDALPRENSQGDESIVKIQSGVRVYPAAVCSALQAAGEKDEGGENSAAENFTVERASDVKASFAGEDFSAEGAGSSEEENDSGYRPVYINNEEKAEENKSSAFVLLITGGLGLVFITLCFLEIVDLGMSPTNRYMVTGVMGVLFILFIIMGMVSMKNSRIFRKKAGSENNLTAEIRKWCRENIEREEVDRILSLQDESEELKYFQRFDYVKKLIQKQFMNLDEGYLDRIMEEIYTEIFEDDAV